MEEVQGAELGVDAEFLGQVAQDAPHGGLVLEDIEAVQADRPRIRLLEGGDGAHERALARAIGPQEGSTPTRSTGKQNPGASGCNTFLVSI